MTRRETGLFPRPIEIGLNCSCPDWAGMCKHVAATLYAVGARLDQSPELLFVLRGADHLELVTAATESVTMGIASADGSAALSGENLEEVFGIEIEPTSLSAVSSFLRSPKARPPKKVVVGTVPKRPKAAGAGKAKVVPAGKKTGSSKRKIKRI